MVSVGVETQRKQNPEILVIFFWKKKFRNSCVFFPPFLSHLHTWMFAQLLPQFFGTNHLFPQLRTTNVFGHGHTHAHAHTLALALSLSLSHTHTYTHTCTHTLSLSHSFTLSRTHAHTQVVTPEVNFNSIDFTALGCPKDRFAAVFTASLQVCSSREIFCWSIIVDLK